MNKSDTDMIVQTFILSMQGVSDYDIMFLDSNNPLVSLIAVKTSAFCKYLINEHDKNKHQEA